MKVGCDIISISRFAKTINKNGQEFLERIFLPSEYNGASLERLAGMFAAKEAACKALGISAGNWRKIRVAYEETGAPKITISDCQLPLTQLSVSISHDGDYAFAVVIKN